MSTRIKAAIGVGVLAILAVVIWASVARKDKNLVRVTTAKVGEGAARLDRELQRPRAGEDEGRHLLAGHGPDRDARRRRGRPRQEGRPPPPDRQGAVRRRTRRRTQAGLDALFAQREADRFAREQAERDLDRTKKNYEATIESEQNLQKAQLALDSAKANENADERRIEQARANLMGNKDSLRKTTLIVADRRRRDGQARRAGRERDRRDDEQPGHRPPDGVRHVHRRGRDGGRRDRHPAREGRPEGEAHVRRVPRQEVRGRRHGDRRQPDHEVRARNGLLGRELQGEGAGRRTRPPNIRPGFSVSGQDRDRPRARPRSRSRSRRSSSPTRPRSKAKPARRATEAGCRGPSRRRRPAARRRRRPRRRRTSRASSS